MKRLLIAVTGGLLAVAAGLVLYIANIDLDEHRATIARAIEEATGRKWTLGTGLRVEWGLKPMLEVKNLALANAPWGTAPNMLTIESACARIALLPLLERRIEVMELAWRGASLAMKV